MNIKNTWFTYSPGYNEAIHYLFTQEVMERINNQEFHDFSDDDYGNVAYYSIEVPEELALDKVVQKLNPEHVCAHCGEGYGTHGKWNAYHCCRVDNWDFGYMAQNVIRDHFDGSDLEGVPYLKENLRGRELYTFNLMFEEQELKELKRNK